MKIKKLVLTIVLLLLVGCSPNAKSKSLQFWTPFTGPDGDYMQKIVDDFNESHEDIQVDMQVIPGDQYYEKLRTAYRGGDSPDIIAIHADQIPSLVQANVLLNLEEYENMFSFNADNFVAEAWDKGIYKDNRYAVPLDIHPLVMYVNEDIRSKLDIEIPITYEDLILNGEKVVENSDYYGFALPTIWPTNLVFRSALLQNGLDVISEDGTESNLDNPKAIEVAHKISDLWDKYEIAPKNLERDGHIDLFKQGKVAFTIDGIWMSQGMEESGVNYTVAPIGNLFGPKEAVWANSHQLSIVNKSDEETIKKAETFINYLSENSLEWAKGGQVPANLSVLNSSEFEKITVPYIASEQMEYVKLAPQVDAWLDIWTPLESKLSESYLGKTPLEKALEEAAKEGNEKAEETLEKISQETGE